jgi:hypothetical protein
VGVSRPPPEHFITLLLPHPPTPIVIPKFFCHSREGGNICNKSFPGLTGESRQNKIPLQVGGVPRLCRGGVVEFLLIAQSPLRWRRGGTKCRGSGHSPALAGNKSRAKNLSETATSRINRSESREAEDRAYCIYTPQASRR